MEEEKRRQLEEAVVTEEALREAEKYIEEEEGPSRRLTGKMDVFITAGAGHMSLVHFDQFIYRSVIPNSWDILFGIVLILLVLEASRRTTGLIMPIIVIAFIIYAFIGPELPKPWTHRGYEIDRLVGHMYMTLEGIFGVPIDVSSTFIILFTIFGAFLEVSGAGKFYIDFSFAAMGGKPTGAGRTVTLASFLLGGPSGSGVTTTVTLGSVAYPMLAKPGYSN